MDNEEKIKRVKVKKHCVMVKVKKHCVKIKCLEEKIV